MGKKKWTGNNYQAGKNGREKILKGRDIQHRRGKVGGAGKFFLAGYSRMGRNEREWPRRHHCAMIHSSQYVEHHVKCFGSASIQ